MARGCTISNPCRSSSEYAYLRRIGYVPVEGHPGLLSNPAWGGFYIPADRLDGYDDGTGGSGGSGSGVSKSVTTTTKSGFPWWILLVIAGIIIYANER